MAVSKAELHSILITAFPKASIEIIDLAGDQDHYSVHVTCASFNKQPLIKQHRMVKAALADILQTKLHAVTIKTSAK